jgi:hypothetical protein
VVGAVVGTPVAGTLEAVEVVVGALVADTLEAVAVRVVDMIDN